VTERLAEFGLRFGLLFQIADDMADRDIVLGPAVDLERLACANARAARISLESFCGSACGGALLALVDSVAARARSAR